LEESKKTNIVVCEVVGIGSTSKDQLMVQLQFTTCSTPRFGAGAVAAVVTGKYCIQWTNWKPAKVYYHRPCVVVTNLSSDVHYSLKASSRDVLIYCYFVF
jgi:hypothetical protein